jgi:PilZ domain
MAETSNSQSSTVTPYTQRRALPRYMFTASVDMVDTSNAMHISGRVAEISRKGCYVDIMIPPPPGTLLKVRIYRDAGAFETSGKIVYIHDRIGMGVAFVDTAEDQLKILDSWLAELPPASAIG